MNNEEEKDYKRGINDKKMNNISRDDLDNIYYIKGHEFQSGEITKNRRTQSPQSSMTYFIDKSGKRDNKYERF